jgi:serine/threonine protein kinase
MTIEALDRDGWDTAIDVKVSDQVREGAADNSASTEEGQSVEDGAGESVEAMQKDLDELETALADLDGTDSLGLSGNLSRSQTVRQKDLDDLEMALAAAEGEEAGALRPVMMAPAPARPRRPSIDKSAFVASVSASRMLERYTEEKKLGEGSFGTVHLVKDKRTGVRRVVKKQQTHDRDAVTVQLLKDEISALARLDSPYIVKLFEFALDDDTGLLYIIEEQLRGKDVPALIHTHGPLEEWLAQKIMRHVLIALAYVHSHGILHRDVKPDNMMLTHVDPARADVKLIDFGLAAFFDIGNEDQILAFAGTPSYMPPEMLGLATSSQEAAMRRVRSLQALQYGGGIDLYSLGATMFEMLTEEKPFGDARKLPGSTLERVRALREIVSRAPCAPRIESLRLKRGGNALLADSARGTPAQELCDRLMAKDPLARPSAVQALEHPWFKLGEERAECASPRSPGDGMDWVTAYPATPYVVKACLVLIANQLDASELEHIRHVFSRLDQNNDGYISRQGLARALAKREDPLGIADEVLKHADLCGDGRLCFTEFVAARLHAELLEGGHVSNRLTQRAFEVLDADGDGFVSRPDMLSLLERSTLPVAEAALAELAMAFPDTQLDVEEFHTFLLEHAQGPTWKPPPRRRWFGFFEWCCKKSSLRGDISRRPWIPASPSVRTSRSPALRTARGTGAQALEAPSPTPGTAQI